MSIVELYAIVFVYPFVLLVGFILYYLWRFLCLADDYQERQKSEAARLYITVNR